MNFRSFSEATGFTGQAGSPISRRLMLRQMAYGTGAALAGSLLAGRSVAAQSEWTKDLRLQFSDGFDTFDMERWTPLLYKSKVNHATVTAENGRAVLRASTSFIRKSPAGTLDPAFSPAVVGLATRGKWFNPGLKGTAGVEVTLVNYKHEGDYVGGTHPGFGIYPMGWTLTIGNYQGPVGFEESADKGISGRSVQIIFDWWMKYGLNNCICRSIMPGEREKYPEFRDWWSAQPSDFTKDGYVIDGKNVTFENIPKPCYDPPCVIPACKLWPAGEVSSRIVAGHRVGLFITDDGNKVHWTLDGKVINSALMPGFVSSSPEGFRQGAYATIYVNGGYRTNTWEYDGVKIYASA